MKKTYATEFQGRAYEVEYDFAKQAEPAYFSTSVYRVRKDGTRGREVFAFATTGSQIVATVSDQISADRDATS